MLKRVYGWRSRAFTIIAHLRSEISYTTKMEGVKALKTLEAITGSNTSIVRSIGPRAGAGGVPVNATNMSGLSGNGPGVQPARKKKGSFGGAASNQSNLPQIQFGSYSSTDIRDSRGIANVELPGSKIEEEKSAASSMAEQDLPVDRTPAPEPAKASSTPRASSTPAWGSSRTVRDSDRNKSSGTIDPSVIPLNSEEDFPALGAPSTGKAGKYTAQLGKPEFHKSDNFSSSNPRGDSSVRVKVPPKSDTRVELGFLGPQGRNYKGDAMRKENRDNYPGGETRDPIDSLGRTLTKILRHQALELNIKLRKDGYADVKELLNLTMKTGSGRPMNSHTVDDVREAVKQDNKQRFGIKEENGLLLIRANQGHTVKTVETDELLKPILTAEEISVCVHGTYRKFLASIAKEGLKRMSRNHVHFASGLSPNEGVISGMRKSSEVLIFLNVSKALNDGMKLYMSENGVILTEGFDGVVPPEYFKDARTWPDNKPVQI